MSADEAGDVAPRNRALGRSSLYFDDDEDQAVPPVRQTHGVRVLLGALLVIAILSLLGVAAVVVFAIEFGESTSTDPAQVSAVLEDIAGIEIPEGFEAEMAVTLKVLPWRRPVMTWAKYSDKQTDSALVVAQLGKDINIHTIGFFNDCMSQIEQSLKSHNAKHKSIPPNRTDTQDVTAGSQTIVCQRAAGVDPDSKTPVICIKAVLQGRHGPAAFILYADTTRYSNATILKLLQSIRGGSPLPGT